MSVCGFFDFFFGSKEENVDYLVKQSTTLGSFFDHGKKMTMNKEKCLFMCFVNPIFNEVEKRKKKTRGTNVRDYEILRPSFSIV